MYNRRNGNVVVKWNPDDEQDALKAISNVSEMDGETPLEVAKNVQKGKYNRCSERSAKKIREEYNKLITS